MAHQFTAHFDVVVVADFRVGDTDADAAVDCIQAMSDAGYRVGVVSWLGAADTDAFEVTPRFASILKAGVRQVGVDAKISSRFLLAFDLRLFRYRAVKTLSVSSQKRLVLCRRGDFGGPKDLFRQLDHARETLGGDFVLAPTATSLRQRLLSLAPGMKLAHNDWPPTLTVSMQSDIQETRRVSRPVVGYYRLAKCRAWPEDVHGSVLPDHPNIAHAVLEAPDPFHETLAGANTPVAFFRRGQTPSFFASIDVITTNADASIDPWPHEILIALAHGVVPILSQEFHQNFFAGAVFSDASSVADRAIELFTDDAYFQDMQHAGRELIGLCLAPEHLINRLRDFIGAPAPSLPVSTTVLLPKRRVLSISSNGIGMGHLTRQMAIARRFPSSITPIFVGFSQAISIVNTFGWLSEYLPYHSGPMLNRAYWNSWLGDALEKACQFYEPSAVILDSNLAFDGVGLLRERRPDLPMVWTRRAFWGPNRDTESLERTPWFDAIIEPGEIAGAYDEGPTSKVTNDVSIVAPLHILDPQDILSQQEALKDLGLSNEDTNVLLLPGAMNNFDSKAFWMRVIEQLSSFPNTSITFATWAMAENEFDLPDHVGKLEGYPFAMWFKAFDFSVSAAGYNSFAELIYLGLPTIFVPNENPLMDRQDLRAKHAVRNCYGLSLRSHSSDLEIKNTLKEIQELENLETISCNANLQKASLGANGAQSAADMITYLAHCGISDQPERWQ